ncbi:Flavin-dependent oxidoreductase, luciferase family (includes alkanesulfonate monooxygenase SsuD and methylene tetrahydromethanopterin reductase) [Streptomyces sp. yr375]|uniref:LLM class flavin-dependent oxidoreductase n=1 Tax=Streptomyces sp. yr375 TaxID=1761906 RepID=UPI0008D38EB5|nr:LLM class flavin-dependent oxidoreductase [Streptomyces sp. yr375]SES30340.1 Flavin-dependent oxidoreductase, luciferase family (includes alkanesulfonate monooxygenase SsuD and methylene tetrahydromethanopterin reductase) [Streptomyces sp. yr375]
MTSSPGRGLLHLAAAVDQPGVHDSGADADAGAYVEAARLAERGGLDFVTLDDTLARSGTERRAGAAAVLARVASVTHRVGLVPLLTVTRAEPVRVPAAIAGLDRVSRGRAGWRIDVSDGAGAVWQEGETGEVADVAGQLSGGREGGAQAGSPQGHPVRVVGAAEGAALAAARYADVALVRATSLAQARAVRDRLRSDAAGCGRDPDSLRVLVSLLIDLGDGECAAVPGHGGGGPRQTVRGPLYRGGPVDLADLIAAWHRGGAADGFHLTPVEPRRDLERLVNGTVALLQHRGLFRTFYPGSTLREHLGLGRPAERYAGGAA